MSGIFYDCAAKTRKLYLEFINAHYVVIHDSNLVITHACKIFPSELEETIENFVNLFCLSNKAGLVLKDSI